MQSTCVVGIDPGKQGAIALLTLDKPHECLFWLLSDVEAGRSTPFDQIVAAYGVKHAYIEKVGARPGQGVVSMFTFGMGFGKLLGWCEMLSLPYTLVTPQVWTKAMHTGCSGTDPKERSAQAARRLFPKENLVRGRGVRLHTGLVDALLIAEYGRRQFK